MGAGNSLVVINRWIKSHCTRELLARRRPESPSRQIFTSNLSTFSVNMRQMYTMPCQKFSGHSVMNQSNR